MPKYIDADRLIRRLEKSTYRAKTKIIDMINEQEAADVEPVRRGRWIKHPWGGGVHTCSVCGERAEVVLTNGYLTGDASPSGETGGYYHYDKKEFLSNYCPICGARMEASE